MLERHRLFSIKDSDGSVREIANGICAGYLAKDCLALDNVQTEFFVG